MSEPSVTEELPGIVVDAFDLDAASVRPMPGGHINRTFSARQLSGARCVVQRVNPIFPAVVHDDIAAVTAHLGRRGMPGPVLIGTRSGLNRIETDSGVWRALSFVAGRSVETLRSDDEAAAAGELLGRFHAALGDLEHEFRSVRSDPHDTARHLAALEEALNASRKHRRIGDVEPVAREILAEAGALEALPGTPTRVVHGDPKISNLMFDPATGAGLCLVDLDTLGRRGLAAELGDAFRSWCNPAGEDAPDADFTPSLFRAAIHGYARGSAGLTTAAERAAIPGAVHTIGVELAARFCADALNERFFHWDRDRFDDASAHNLARARAQLAVARGARQHRDALQAAIADAFTAAVTQR